MAITGDQIRLAIQAAIDGDGTLHADCKTKLGTGADAWEHSSYHALKTWHNGLATILNSSFVPGSSTSLTSGYVPYWSGSALADSPIYISGVQIGLGTTSITSDMRLEADGSINTKSATNWNYAQYYLRRTATNDQTNGFKLSSFMLGGDSHSDTNLYAYWNFVMKNGSVLPGPSTVSSGVTEFRIQGPGPFIVGLGSSEVFRATVTGRVGIGTTAPISRLHVDRNAEYCATIGPGYNGGTAYNTGNVRPMITAWTGYPGICFAQHNVNGHLIESNNGSLRFLQGYDGLGGERLVLKSDGTVFIPYTAAIGPTPSANIGLYVSKTFSATVTTYAAILEVAHNTADASNAKYGTVVINSATHTSGTIAAIVGNSTNAYVSGASGTTTNLYGVIANFNVSAGSVGSAYGLLVSRYQSGTASAITGDSMGIRIAEHSYSGSGTKPAVNYGLFIDHQTSGTANYAIVTNAGTVNFAGLGATGGVVCGSPTGGDKGAGTINVAGDVYKNNSAYTNPDYVLELAFHGAIQKYKENAGAADYKWLTLDEVKAFAKEHLRLPGIGGDAPCGMFRRADFVLEKIEELFLHLFDKEAQINRLTARVAALEVAHG